MKVEVKGTQYLRMEAKDIHISHCTEGNLLTMTLHLDGEEACTVFPIDSVYVDGELVWGKDVDE